MARPHPDPLPRERELRFNTWQTFAESSLESSAGTTPPSPWGEGRGKNSPNEVSRFEPLNRNPIGAPSTVSASIQPILQRAEAVLGAPVYGEGDRQFIPTASFRPKPFATVLLLVAALLCGCGKPATPPTVGTITPSASSNALPGEPTEAQPRLPTVPLLIGPATLFSNAVQPADRNRLQLDPDIRVITAEIATTRRQIETGMMFRTNMLENEGMLFVFGQPHQVGFWMKNCPLPMSCAYLDAKGVILELHDMEPSPAVTR
jgi:hypothetical protein